MHKTFLLFLFVLALFCPQPLMAQSQYEQGMFDEIIAKEAPLTQADVDAYINIVSGKSDEEKIVALQKSNLSEERLFFVATKVALGMEKLKIKGAPGLNPETFVGLEPNKDELDLLKKNKKRLAR